MLLYSKKIIKTDQVWKGFRQEMLNCRRAPAPRPMENETHKKRTFSAKPAKP